MTQPPSFVRMPQIYIHTHTQTTNCISFHKITLPEFPCPGTAMADWSELPKELLQVIAERLDSPFYVLRFRSVCSPWRSSVSIKHRPLPSKFPILSNGGTFQLTSSFSLLKRTIYLVGAPGSNPDPWLIKIEDEHGRLEHLNLFSRFQTKSLPVQFPKVVDFYELPVVELGREYVLNRTGFYHFNSLEDVCSLYMEKVVFLWSNYEREEFVLLTIHVSGKLALFKSGDSEWAIIPNMPTPYDDVIAFNGKLYAVDNLGRTVLVGLDGNVSLIAEPVFGGDKKLLVESNGELLLVDKYLSTASDQDSGFTDEFDDELEGSACEKAVIFEVFKLEEEEKKWIEMRGLGDRVLFLGDDCTFSASGSDLSIGKRNCIIFKDDFFYLNGEEIGIRVFHLDDRRVSPLSDYPEYSKLFWPPRIGSNCWDKEIS